MRRPFFGGALTVAASYLRGVALDAGRRALVAVLADATHGPHAHEVGEALALATAVCAWRVQRDPRDVAGDTRAVVLDVLVDFLRGTQESNRARFPPCACAEPRGGSLTTCDRCFRLLPGEHAARSAVTFSDLAAGVTRASEAP